MWTAAGVERMPDSRCVSLAMGKVNYRNSQVFTKLEFDLDPFESILGIQ